MPAACTGPLTAATRGYVDLDPCEDMTRAVRSLVRDLVHVIRLPERHPLYFASPEDVTIGEVDTFALALIAALRPLVRSVRGESLV